MNEAEYQKRLESILARIDRVRAVIPSSEEHLHTGLESCKQSIMFSSPELLGNHIQKACIFLGQQLGDPTKLTEPWQLRVCNIWSGKEDQ